MVFPNWVVFDVVFSICKRGVKTLGHQLQQNLYYLAITGIPKWYNAETQLLILQHTDW